MKCYRIISRNTETKEYILIKYDSLLSDIFINDDNIKIFAVTAPKRLVARQIQFKIEGCIILINVLYMIFNEPYRKQFFLGNRQWKNVFIHRW